MDPIAIIECNKEYPCVFAKGRSLHNKLAAPETLFMVLKAMFVAPYITLMIYPMDEYIKGSNILEFKSPTDYCSSYYMKPETTSPDFKLIKPNLFVIKDLNNKDAVEVTNGNEGKITAKSLIKPENLPKPELKPGTINPYTTTGYSQTPNYARNLAQVNEYLRRFDAQ